MINKRIDKYALFSRDFRGLPDGWHNVRACNFLVGENSTGKSSFLQLIQLIDSREHMVFLDICGIVDGIDTPFDVCSRLSGSKQTTVGFLIKENPDHTHSRSKGTFGRLATYKSVGNEMHLERLTMVSGGHILRLKKTKDRISYRFDKFSYDQNRTHIENASNVEELHFRTSDRFRRHFAIETNHAPAATSWHEAMHTAISDDPNAPDRGFLAAYPPLSCLHHGPFRAKTRRLYHGQTNEFSSTGEHFPYVMREIQHENPSLGEAVNKFGIDSGLFDKISITSVRTAIQDKPFALEVLKSGSHFYVDELGYGVGQVLPIIADITFTPQDQAFLIQQPELHLHPRAQASLGEVFLQATAAGGIFVIETHSDYIIDRFRLKLSSLPNPPRTQIVYFESAPDGKNVCHEIELMADGSISEAPENYRSFFLNESLSQLGLDTSLQPEGDKERA